MARIGSELGGHRLRSCSALSALLSYYLFIFRINTGEKRKLPPCDDGWSGVELFLLTPLGIKLVPTLWAEQRSCDTLREGI